MKNDKNANYDKKISEKIPLSQYLEKLLSEGRRHFTTEEIMQSLSMSKNTVSNSLSRLARKQRVKMIRKGFGIILGFGGIEPDPSYFLDAMMNHLGVSYYVGLLTAAKHWGAGHQASMTYQVMVNKSVFKLSFEKMKIDFIAKLGTFPKDGIKKVASLGGYIQISTPELTAIDLVRFTKKAGHLSNIATVLSELIEKVDLKAFPIILSDVYTPTVTLQRLGFLLDEILNLKKEAVVVAGVLKERRFTSTYLSSAKKNNKAMSNFDFNKKWKLYINTKIEADE